MVEEDGGILRWCDQGVRDDFRVWAGEQPTEITTRAIDLEFLPTDTNEDREVQNLEFVLQQMHTALMALTGYMIRRQEEENETFCADHFSWTVLSSGNPSGVRTLGVLSVSLREKDQR